MDSSTAEYHQLQPPSSLLNDTPTTSTNKSPFDAPTKDTQNTNDSPIDNIATSSSNSNNNQEQYNSMQNASHESSNSETIINNSSNNNINQQQLPTSSTEITGPCDNSSNGSIIATINDRNPNNDVHLNRVTTSFSESRMIDSNNSGSSSNSSNHNSIRSDQIVSQDCNAKKESCPTNLMETTNSNQIINEINRIEYAVVAAASKESCDSSEVIDSDIKDVLPKVNSNNEMGHCESSGANLESTTIKSPAEYSESMRSNSSISSVCNNGNDNISGNRDSNVLGNNNEDLDKLEKCASTAKVTVNEMKLPAESNQTKNNDNISLPLDISAKASRESVDRTENHDLSSIIDSSRYCVPRYHHTDSSINYSKIAETAKVQYSANTYSKLPTDRVHDSSCDSSVAVSRSNSFNYKPTHHPTEDDLSKMYSKQVNRNYNTNVAQHSKEDHRSRAEKAIVQTSSANPISNWVMDSRRYDPLPSKTTLSDHRSHLPTESNYYARYESHNPYAMPASIDKSSNSTKQMPPFEAYGYPRTAAETTQINYSSSSIDLSKPSPTKSNSLYVSNPDFSKHHSSSTKDLSPLRMKPPDFSKAATHPQSQPDHQNSSTVIKNYNHTTTKATTPYSVNANNFAEISKKLNYISDLQLKNPTKIPVGHQPMPSDISKSNYNSLYVKTPDFQKSSKSDKMPKPHSQVLLPHDEPTAHIIHKNQFQNSLPKPVPDPVSLYKNFPQISQDVTMSIVAPHHQHHHESGAVHSRDKYPSASATMSTINNDARLKYPETNPKPEYKHQHSSYEEYVLQKSRQAENDKYREQYYRTESQHVEQQHPSIRYMNESAHYKPASQDKSPQFPMNDSRIHASQQRQSLRSDYGYPDLNKSDSKYEKSETSHRYSSYSQYPASQAYQNKADPQRYPDTSYGTKTSIKQSSSSSRMQQSSVPPSIPHAATSPSPSAKMLRSPFMHSKPTDYTGQMNPPQHWPSQPLTSRISQSPISLSSSPISQNTGHRVSQSPIGASPSPHHFGGISQSPNYMYASPHATPSPSQLTSSSSAAPSPVHFKHSPSPYYMLPPNQQSPAQNQQQYYQAETVNRYSASYPKTEQNYNPMMQIKTEPISRDYYTTSMADRSAQMKKMPSDYIDLTKTPKPETYSASARNLDCCSKYPVSLNTPMNTRNDFMNHRTESTAHRTETSTHRTDHPMHELTPHRIESMINRPELIAQRNENLLHRSEPMLNRMDQTNQKHSSDGKADRPNFNQPKTIMDPYLYRNASEADLNYQIIKKTLGDIQIRRSDTDLSRNIFDSPRSNPKPASMYQSTSNVQYLKELSENSYKASTGHQSPFAAEVFLQRNPDVKVIQKSDAPKNPNRMMSKMNESVAPKTNHSHDVFARTPAELSKHDLSVTVSRISATMTKPTHRQQPEKNEPHSSNYNFNATKVAKAKTENVSSLQQHSSSPSSTTVSSSKSVFAPVKRESPLDLSVKTVKTIADSTGCDDYGQCSSSRRRDTHISPSLKIDFSPNFQKHAQTQVLRKPTPTGHSSETQAQVLEVAKTQSPYLQHNSHQASRGEGVTPASNSGVYDKRSDIRYLDPDGRSSSSDSKPYTNDGRKSLTLNPSVPTVFGQKPEDLKNLPINDIYCEPSFDNRLKMNQTTALKPKDEAYNQNTVNHNHSKENQLKYVSEPVYKADNRVEPNQKTDNLYPQQPRSDARYADPYYDYRDRRPVSNYYANPYGEAAKNIFPPQSRPQEELRESRTTHQPLEECIASKKRPSESYSSEQQYVPSKKSRYDEPKNYPNNYGYYMPSIVNKYFPPSAQQAQTQQPNRDHPLPKIDQSNQQAKVKESDIKVPISHGGSVTDTSKYYPTQNPPPTKATQESQRRPDNYYPNPMNDRSYEAQYQHQNSNQTDNKLYYPEAKKEIGPVRPVHTGDQSDSFKYDTNAQQDSSKQVQETRPNVDPVPTEKSAHPEYQYNPYYFGQSEKNYTPSKSHQEFQSYQQWRAQTMSSGTSDYYNRMQFHPRPMMPSQPYPRKQAEYPDFKNTSDTNITTVSDASKSQSRIYQSETQQRPNTQLKGADQNVISKLRTNLEMKEIEKQKLLKSQSSTETAREDDDTNKSDIASLIAARIRTKGELKGFTPTIETKPTPEEEPDEVNIVAAATTVAPSVDQSSDLESSTALDLLDWGSACNDFVEQLQGGGTKKRRRRKVRTKSSVDDPKLETVEQEYALENLPGIAYKCDDESLVKIVKAENKSIVERDEMVSKKNDESSSDEDMPLHILRQQSLNESAKIKEECTDDVSASAPFPPPSPPQAKLEIKEEPLDESAIVKNETQVVKNENCDKSDSSSRMGQQSSESKRIPENSPRNKKEKQREKREQEKKMSISSSSDSEAEINRPMKRMKKVTRKLRSRASVEMKPSSCDESSDHETNVKKEKRKNIDSSSSDAEQICSPRKSARRQFSSQERTSKKSTRQSSDEDTTANEDNRDDQKTPAKSNSNNLKPEETMTRSKRKRELENQIANSKVLRNEKVVKNVITPDRKTCDSRKSSDKSCSKSSSEKQKPSSRSTSKSEEHKRKILDSDNEASKPSSMKKKPVRVTKLQTSSSENEQSEAEEMLAERLRSRKVKPSTEPALLVTPEKEKKWSRTPKKAATPSKPPAKTETFPPGWEEQVYEYKRSLKVPASLITIGRPPTHRKSVSLPDLDPHSSDASETFAENKRQIQLKEKELKRGKAGTTKAPDKIEVEDNTKSKSIIDVLHQRVIRPVKNNRHKARPINNAPKILPQSNEVELLPTPGAEGIDVFKHHSVFETAVLKSRTRKEYRAQKNQEIIREVFGCDDRPASAPPEQTAPGTKENEPKPEPVTFDQKYKQYLEKMNIDFGEKIRKLKNVNKPTSTVSEPQTATNTTTTSTTTATTLISAPEKLDEDSILNQDDETQDTEINECERMADDIKEEPMDQNERDTPSVLSERDGMTPNSMNSSKVKKARGNRSNRRKGSSGK